MAWLSKIALVWCGVSLATVGLMAWARGRIAASAETLDKETAALARWAGR